MSWPFKDTSEIAVSNDLLEQVVGQERAVEIIKIAARQRRFVLLVGDPGTGKSMLGKALAQNLAPVKQESILVFHNKMDRTRPKVKVVDPKAVTTEMKHYEKLEKDLQRVNRLLFGSCLLLIAVVAGVFSWVYDQPVYLFWGALLLLVLLWYRKKIFPVYQITPKLLFPVKIGQWPFVDATGCHEGGLLGDVRHDPYQSGGSETPPHLLVEAGAIHRANKGVLYIDEVSMLSVESQLALLTAIQNKDLPITGRSPGSSGNMVQTEAVPCDFTLVIAGHQQDVENLHPALRSRMKGYGYEVLMNNSMQDTQKNRAAFAQFVAQEVWADGKIPHFTFDAVEALIEVARELSGIPGMMSCCFRDMGGLVRAAGDQAIMRERSLVTREEVRSAKTLHISIETQTRIHANNPN